MIRAVMCAVAVLGTLTAVPPASAEGNADYSVLIISRERLEVATNCEIGIYLNGQLTGRLFQEQSTAFNLPAGPVDVRLRMLPGQAPGCGAGLVNQHQQQLNLSAGQINKYRISMSQNGLHLTRAGLGY
ncbi:hypothetical protein [Pseudomonas sp.]|uniref:hypothetical protein n=1 Tax=Pseudomonas sp. TaxID=306 RepID=UPI0028A870AB|nr:hypothetical protein [Pseudomonas sp.]